MDIRQTESITEAVGETIYTYYPLGEHVVVAPGICGGRPTFKYTRLEVSMILSRLASGETIRDVVEAYTLSRLSTEAVQEAVRLADQALLQLSVSVHPAGTR